MVLSGCGTSGRIGFATASSWNRVLALLGSPAKPLFQYCHSGGDPALLLSDGAALQRAGWAGTHAWHGCCMGDWRHSQRIRAA